MKKDNNYFIKEFEKQRLINKRLSNSNIVYGSNIMPILKIFKDLSTDERITFIEVLEHLLTDLDDEKRKYAIDICLGFFIFRDEI